MSEYGSGWRPNDALPKREPITLGCLVAWKFRPWRVIEMFDAPRRDTDGPWVTQRYGFVLRPAQAQQWQTASSADEHGTSLDPKPFDVIREHYGLCVHCNELLPCREQELQWAVDRGTQHMARYDVSGVCPACGEVVTHRQERETLPNTVVPGGPPVTFHMGRRSCRYSAEQYRAAMGQVDTNLTLDTDTDTDNGLTGQ